MFFQKRSKERRAGLATSKVMVKIMSLSQSMARYIEIVKKKPFEVEDYGFHEKNNLQLEVEDSCAIIA